MNNNEEPKWLPPKFPRKFIIVWLLIGALPFMGGLWGRMMGTRPDRYWHPNFLLTLVFWLVALWGLSNSVPRRADAKLVNVGNMILGACAVVGVVLLIIGIFVYVSCSGGSRVAP